MFVPENTTSYSQRKSRYKPGVYTSSITLNENTFDVEVTVNADRIKAIRLVNLNEATKASYPLMEPVLDSLASQIYSSQSLEDIQYAGDRKYTSQVLLSAITDAVKKSGEHLSSPLCDLRSDFNLLQHILPDPCTCITWHSEISSWRKCHTTYLRAIRQTGTLELLGKKSPIEGFQPFQDRLFIINPLKGQAGKPVDLIRCKSCTQHVIQIKIMKLIRSYQILRPSGSDLVHP